MLRLSRLADYAIVILCSLARRDDQVSTARALAEQTGVPWPTVVKLLKVLNRRGLLRSVQGRQGGYRLARPPAEISLAEVIEAVEGPVALTGCTREPGSCGLRELCDVQGHWERINGAVRTTLSGISLRELARPAACAERPRSGARA